MPAHVSTRSRVLEVANERPRKPTMRNSTPRRLMSALRGSTTAGTNQGVTWISTRCLARIHASRPGESGTVVYCQSFEATVTTV
jgi:hypothetical protein